MDAKDGVLTRFVLDDVTEEERSALEEQFFANDELFARLLEAESDLIDEYLAGTLAGNAREAFERRLASSPSWREKVEFGQALRDGFLEKGAPAELVPVPLGRFFRTPGVLLALAATLVVAVGAAWFAGESARRDAEQRLEESRSALQQKIQELEAKTAEQRARTDQLASDLATARMEQAKAAVTPGPARVLRTVSFVLAAGLTRDVSPANRLVVPKDADEILLLLPLESREYETFRAAIETASGRKVVQRIGLQARPADGNREVPLSVTSSLLPDGDYVLLLQGRARGGAFEAVAEYAFRIVKR